MILDLYIHSDKIVQENFLEDCAQSLRQHTLQFNNTRSYHARAESGVETLRSGEKMIIFTEPILLVKFPKNI